MLRGKLIYISILFSCLAFGQQKNKMLQASIQQASSGGVTNLWITGDATSTDSEANDVSQWTGSCSAACLEITSVANTDSQGGAYALNLHSNNDNQRSAYVIVSGLNTTPHTATFRIRRVVGATQIQGWTGATGITYNVDFDSVSNGTWITGTVNFTPTGPVTVRFHANLAIGDVNSEIEISEIIITED